jgi:hypothetical protein
VLLIYYYYYYVTQGTIAMLAVCSLLQAPADRKTVKYVAKEVK